MITSKIVSSSRHVRTHSLTGVSNLFAEITGFSSWCSFWDHPHTMWLHIWIETSYAPATMWCSLPPSLKCIFVWLFKWKSDIALFIRVTESRFIHLLHAHQLQVWMHELDLPQWSETRTKMHRLVRIFSHGADGHLREEEEEAPRTMMRAWDWRRHACLNWLFPVQSHMGGRVQGQWHCPPSQLHRETNCSWSAGGLGPGWPLHKKQTTLQKGGTCIWEVSQK